MQHRSVFSAFCIPGRKKTYANKGDGSIWVRRAGLGLDKRKCTIKVAIFADAVSGIESMVVFREKGLRIPQKEKDSYERRVIFCFQQNTWVDESETRFWMNHLYKPTCADGRRKLFVADIHRAQKTDAVKKAMIELNTTMALIPLGCASLLQPLDLFVFGTMKQKLEELQNRHMHSNVSLYVNNEMSAAQRRILITKCIGDVWSEITANALMIQRSSVKCRIALSPDGLMDSDMHLECLPDYEFPDLLFDDDYDGDISQEIPMDTIETVIDSDDDVPLASLISRSASAE